MPFFLNSALSIFIEHAGVCELSDRIDPDDEKTYIDMFADFYDSELRSVYKARKSSAETKPIELASKRLVIRDVQDIILKHLKLRLSTDRFEQIEKVMRYVERMFIGSVPGKGLCERLDAEIEAIAIRVEKSGIVGTGWCESKGHTNRDCIEHWFREELGDILTGRNEFTEHVKEVFRHLLTRPKSAVVCYELDMILLDITGDRKGVDELGEDTTFAMDTEMEIKPGRSRRTPRSTVEIPKGPKSMPKVMVGARVAPIRVKEVNKESAMRAARTIGNYDTSRCVQTTRDDLLSVGVNPSKACLTFRPPFTREFIQDLRNGLNLDHIK